MQTNFHNLNFLRSTKWMMMNSYLSFPRNQLASSRNERPNAQRSQIHFTIAKKLFNWSCWWCSWDWSALGRISFTSRTHIPDSKTRPPCWEAGADQAEAENIRTPSRIGEINCTGQSKLSLPLNRNRVTRDILYSMKQAPGTSGRPLPTREWAFGFRTHPSPLWVCQPTWTLTHHSILTDNNSMARYTHPW